MGAVHLLGEVGDPLGLPPGGEAAAQGSALGEGGRKPSVAAPAVAAAPHTRVILEKHVEGTEVAVSILGNRMEARRWWRCAPLGLFDFEARYTTA